MPFAISKDKKQNTNLFLFSLAALSICTFRFGSNGVDGIGVFWTRGAMMSHTFLLHVTLLQTKKST
jgi:hypothetical protein